MVLEAEMGNRADNAIIMAAGMSSRFAPVSDKTPKSLITVRGEVLIERQIQQLHATGISEVIVVTGYMAEKLAYLKDKFGVILIYNHEYCSRNNNASIYAAKEYLGNSYICSADNYFMQNPFVEECDEAYYAGVFVEGETDEWCIHTDEDGFIDHVTIGGADSWIMLGHAFWNKQYSKTFLDILTREYNAPRTAKLLWEGIYMEHLDILKMKLKKYPDNFIYEFDTVEELRRFDGNFTYYFW